MAVRRSGGGFATLNAALKELDGIEAKTGWFETARYPDGMPVATVAYIQEHGAITRGGAIPAMFRRGGPGGNSTFIPARPFMRQTVAAKGDEWLKLLGQGAASVLKGKHTATQVMELVALKAAADVAVTITNTFYPPNAPSTIARKGMNAPLRDTKQMLQSVTGIVEKAK